MRQSHSSQNIYILHPMIKISNICIHFYPYPTFLQTYAGLLNTAQHWIIFYDLSLQFMQVIGPLCSIEWKRGPEFDYSSYPNVHSFLCGLLLTIYHTWITPYLNKLYTSNWVTAQTHLKWLLVLQKHALVYFFLSKHKRTHNSLIS